MDEALEPKTIVGKILLWLLFALGIFIIGCFIFRSYKMSDIDLCDDILCSEKTYEAYDDGDFRVYTYGLRKRFESIEANQLMQLKFCYYIPETKQLQVTLKYNTSYADAPTKEKIPFILYLRDEKGNVLEDYFYDCGDKYGYGYIRLCFEDVEKRDNCEYTLYVDMPGEDGEVKNLSRFTLLSSTSAYEETKLNKKIASALLEREAAK